MRSSSWCLVIASALAAVSIGVATGSRSAAAQQPQPAEVVRPPVNYSCEIPYDVVLPDPKDFNRQANFDIYSWNIFLALNWPATTSTSGTGPCNLQNGVARDCGKPLPSGDYGPTVWETHTVASSQRDGTVRSTRCRDAIRSTPGTQPRHACLYCG
jgi:hypothetical protein